jgi:hypothetical protein
MNASIEEFADFNGVLVERHYKPGEKYIQLVFKTSEGLKLSLSRNLKMVQRLKVGHSYNVKGPQYTVGEKSFVQDPIATLILKEVTKKAETNINRRFIYTVLSILVLIVGSVSALAFSSQGPTLANDPSLKKVNLLNKQTPTTSNSLSTSQNNTSQTQTSGTSNTSNANTYAASTTKKTPTESSSTQTTSSSTPASSDTSSDQDSSSTSDSSTDQSSDDGISGQTGTDDGSGDSTGSDDGSTPSCDPTVDPTCSTTPTCDPTVDPTCSTTPTDTNGDTSSN